MGVLMPAGMHPRRVRRARGDGWERRLLCSRTLHSPTQGSQRTWKPCSTRWVQCHLIRGHGPRYHGFRRVRAGHTYVCLPNVRCGPSAIASRIALARMTRSRYRLSPLRSCCMEFTELLRNIVPDVRRSSRQYWMYSSCSLLTCLSHGSMHGSGQVSPHLAPMLERTTASSPLPRYRRVGGSALPTCATSAASRSQCQAHIAELIERPQRRFAR